ncbi:hypothetical protein [Saccharothrix algeriensis]|uniref:Uncharacterized protein n=1 Tax=Saccharothrix algeriensis TaxID=173560 RepID=A0A8T8I1Q1_9PSEU|nr:hypothetical protein [Saccharothrix algeriensis]MBM7810595.1 hypothetical protein [Saccharothrix algeriensis]QTR04686.1 hypothetical protein J7S33_07585 [Saccharothrix algeriensis]
MPDGERVYNTNGNLAEFGDRAGGKTKVEYTPGYSNLPSAVIDPQAALTGSSTACRPCG